ncbi:MAG TPA: hypothetical protein VN688_16580 [Gemmataceae bacterium]|nr:hypothetical protein [Gemmataceae bacterium]
MSALAMILTAGMTVGIGPEKGSSEVRDEVIEKIDCFRRESDLKKRRDLAKQLGPIHDARVTLALMEVVLQEDAEPGLLVVASSMLVHHHIPEKDWGAAKYWTICRLWWEKNEADVRRRANKLPYQ